MSPGRALAAAQMVPLRGDVEENLARHARLVERAADEGARVVVFPELSLTGYELDLGPALAFSERDPRLAPLVELAAARETWLVAGAPVRVGARLHIGAFLLAPEGTIELYTKQRLGAFSSAVAQHGVLPPAERSYFEPGERGPLLLFDGHAAALAVCADTGRPGHAEEAARRGADTFLASMFFTPSELADERARLAGYARRHRMAVVMANFGAASGGLAAAGGSAVWSEEGKLLAELEGPGAGVVVALEGVQGWRGRAFALDGAT